MVTKIENSGELLAMVLSPRNPGPGVHFMTPDDLPLQVAVMNHPVSKVILPHLHQPVRREVQYTSEVLIIKRGKLRVDFYDRSQKYLESRILEAGDMIVLVSGGHGFEVLEELEMIEVKQGPFAGTADKVRFDPVSSTRLQIKK